MSATQAQTYYISSYRLDRTRLREYLESIFDPKSIDITVRR